MSLFRKGQTVTLKRASYFSTTPIAPREAIIAKVRVGYVHLDGWEFSFDASTGRQIIPSGHTKPLSYSAWIEA